ncbi:hypothetical protein PRIPAC_97594 [Pristionchus pacificus]|uniref:Uncharacterized protein n=1 Tax=Pristionchus pacificus TaxID=54126 RepID=A0A2A6B3C8_PRIPA|nr:hypothetical protein PRIPAC_97594 [Pristionchus pacificus]|eukprot:PDM60380.1 hypothetical protein PRIPAC_54205 [Pristionchus pacificus]
MNNDDSNISGFAAQHYSRCLTPSSSSSSSFGGSSSQSDGLGGFSSSSSNPGMTAVSNPFFIGNMSSSDQDRLKDAFSRSPFQ